MTKAYAYLRVSSKGQVKDKDGNPKDGFTRQAAAISKYAKENSVEIVETFQEPISGITDEVQRPEFTRMVSAILANGVRTVIVESLDRLSRSVALQDQLLIYLASKDIALINATTEVNVTEDYKADPYKRALIQMQAVFSELEKNRIVLRLRAGRERKKDRGEKGEGAKGYRDSPEGIAIMRLVLALRRTRKYGGRRTLQEVADELNKMGKLTFGGKPWTAQNVQQALKAPKERKPIKPINPKS
jgi:site-specific DNA recombinase